MKLGWSKTIFRRLLMSNLLIAFIGIGAVGIAISYMVKGYLYEATQQELLREARKVNLSIQSFPEASEELQALLVFFDQTFDARIWVFDATGKIIATSSQDEVSVGKSVSPAITEKVMKGEQAINALQFEGLTEPMLSVAIPWGKEEELYGGIVMHAPTADTARAVGNVRETVLWITLFGLLISVLMVSYLSWSISRPLQNIARTATEIGMGKYGSRAEGGVADEIDELAANVNALGQKLKRMDEERKKSDRIRDDFLANISHELRTPLTAMQGFLEALQDGLIPEEGRRKYYDVMYQETLQMNRLVDDLIDLIKLENHEIKLNRYPIDIEPLFQKLAFKFEAECKDRGLEFRIRLAEHLPKGFADIDRLEQILSNLLANAIKFTEQGSIELSASAESGKLLLEVTDTGAGIADHDIHRIWERFFKTDRGRSRKNKGAGLGLAIVKELVELHGGSITVRSRLNEGTTFQLRLEACNDSKGEVVARIGASRVHSSNTFSS